MLKKINKKFICFVIAFAMVFTNFLCTVNIGQVYGQDAKNQVVKEEYNVNDAVEALKNQFKDKKELKGWEVVAAKKAGLDLSNFKIDKETEKYKDDKNPLVNKADQSLILMELGEKPEVLMKEISKKLNEYIEKGLVNANTVESIYALETYNELFKDSKIDYNYEKAIKAMVKKQTETGLIGEFDVNTAEAVTILSKHKEVEGADKALNLALKYLKNRMKKSGALYNFSLDVDNHSKIVYILSKYNINFKQDFVNKEGKTLIDGLFAAWDGKNFKERYDYLRTKKSNEALGRLLNAVVSLKEQGYGDYVLKGVNFDGYKKGEAIGEKTETNVDGKLTIENLTKNKEFKLGNDAKVKVKAVNGTKENKSVTLIIALYDKNGKCKAYSSAKQVLKSGQEVELEAMMNLPEQGEYTFKAVVWDSLENMNPLTDAIIIPVVK